MGETFRIYGKMKQLIHNLDGKHHRKTSLWKPRRRWKDCIKMYFSEMKYERMPWIQMTQEMVQRRGFVNTL
jgi:hypothetical protein